MPGDSSDNYAIVPHPREPRALLLPGEAGWAPPPLPSADERETSRAMRERFGIATTVLRAADGRAGRHPEAKGRVYALEVHTPDWTPPAGARWIGRDELRDLPLAIPEHRAVLDAWLAEAGEAPPLRPPWARAGWFAAAAAWVAERMDQLGDPLTGPIEQFHVRSWATVLRAPTASGGVYFKAVVPCFGFEPTVTRFLAARFPEHIPAVLAIDAERGWMLSADAGKRLREIVVADRDPAHWEALLPRFARMQMACAADAGRLVALGCPDRRLEALPAAFAALVADRETLLVGRAGGLAEGEWARARGMAGEVAALCAALARYPIPATIHHDDFGPGNMLIGPRGAYLFLDWSESAVAHPFFTLWMALRWGRMVLDYDAATLDGLRDAYLAPWAALAPRADLVAAFAPAARLAKLARALTYQHYVRCLEPAARAEFADSAPYFLRMFLNDDEGEDD